MLNTFEADTQATKRALAEDPDSSAFWITPVSCRVYGRTGTEYTVRVIGDPTVSRGYTCDCPAGENGRLCWHVAAAKLRRNTCRQPETPKERGIVCPSCGGTIDPKTGICLTGRLFGGCDYRPAARS